MMWIETFFDVLSQSRRRQSEDDVASSVRVQTGSARRGLPVRQERVRSAQGDEFPLFLLWKCSFFLYTLS